MKPTIAYTAALTLLLSACAGDKADEGTVRAKPAAETAEVTDNGNNTADVSAVPGKEAATPVSAEDKVTQAVWSIPEVMALDARIRKKTGGKRGLKTMIASEPSDDQEYFFVSVAEDNGEALATYWQFRVYPDMTIYYYDVVEDGEMTLDEWRKSGNNK